MASPGIAATDHWLWVKKSANEKKVGNFRRFASNTQAVTANQKPEQIPNPAAVLGIAFWYLLYFVGVNKLSENVCRTFIQDVVRMLRQNERVREELN